MPQRRILRAPRFLVPKPWNYVHSGPSLVGRSRQLEVSSRLQLSIQLSSAEYSHVSLLCQLETVIRALRRRDCLRILRSIGYLLLLEPSRDDIR